MMTRARAEAEIWAYLWDRLNEATLRDVHGAQAFGHAEDVQTAQEARAALLVKLARLSRGPAV